jgi:FrmR/RcnR family transcriptional regulator, repressor of frmRAB operon
MPSSALYRLGTYAIYEGMTHTVREKHKLLVRVRRIRGQVEAIERALDGEAGCEQVMHLIAGVRGAIAGLMAEVVEDHVRTHLVDTEKHPDALRAEAAEQLLDVVRTYLK